MNSYEAQSLAQFIKDHDKRFEAKARADDADSVVLLTSAADGTEFDPIHEIAQYHVAYIQQDDPGPTVRAAWDQWQPRTDR